MQSRGGLFDSSVTRP
nr:unnamed protein product [Callosobruchus chinensis]